MPNLWRRQQGATMVVALVMLVLLTLFALSAMNASNTSLKIASNTQTRNEVMAAVQQEIDKAISVAFTESGVFTPGAKPVDINNDGTVDYNVVVNAPACLSAVPISNTALPDDEAGAKCKRGGINPGNMSYCSNTVWDIGASATDPISGANATIHQGIGVRVLAETCG